MISCAILALTIFMISLGIIVYVVTEIEKKRRVQRGGVADGAAKKHTIEKHTIELDSMVMRWPKPWSSSAPTPPLRRPRPSPTRPSIQVRDEEG